MPEATPIPLARLTTLRTGGAPERMVDARTRDELIAALHEAWSTDEPWLVLGGGSNLFVGDEPLEGTVIRVLTSGVERMPGARPGTVRLRVAAGRSWDDLGGFTVDGRLARRAAMSGIPGTVAGRRCRTWAPTVRRSSRLSSRSSCSTRAPTSR